MKKAKLYPVDGQDTIYPPFKCFRQNFLIIREVNWNFLNCQMCDIFKSEVLSTHTCTCSMLWGIKIIGNYIILTEKLLSQM